ncbi:MULTISPECIES: phosphoglycerate dehydrogenase [unclassified Schaalia]|uniref:phosphoglycerate dehydrogenase n=1 Tax=unclassified Schaalia TaxID=2691889 RepID=UPI001E59EC97|nr:MULTISPECIES: phosphoglycerate dehydrogenase [unclassified Schaalia]MCD4549228.1 phosphoglycerate dehydrogenase [Schaalia sp. lx-260]MCD4557037.1 phosphoglycerate dehydrogenase [Schaalia sp. lx-100]
MTRVLLLENPHRVSDDVFQQAGIEVIRHTGALDEDELIQALDGVDYVGVRSKTMVTERVLRARPHLRAIGAFCIGTNQIDLGCATSLGIAVFNAPYSNTRSVVELAIGHIINLSRRVTVKNSCLHRGIWDKSADGAHEVRGHTLGIIGYGNIGKQLSVLAEAMGLNVIYYDVAEKLSLGNATQMPTLESVLREADIVSIHVNGLPDNAGLFGEREFSLMKRGALFINLSRGFVVDVESLRDHLLSGHLAGAALDVFPSEPKANGDPFTSVLSGLDNVILTPHIGGSTEEAQWDIGRFVSGKIVDFEKTGSTDMSVNLPNLQLHSSPSARFRISLVHRNTPGVLALVNQVFAESGANIESQILSTSGSTGYVLTDISSELPVEALAAIEQMNDTIRLVVTAIHR